MIVAWSEFRHGKVITNQELIELFVKLAELIDSSLELIIQATVAFQQQAVCDSSIVGASAISYVH